mgnify:FL=1
MEILDYENNPQQIVYAGFMKRFVANLIDFILVALSGWAIGLIFGVNIFNESWGVKWFNNILTMIYFIVMEAGKNNATLGKQIVGIKVVTTNGEPITLQDSLVRNLCKILSAALLMIGFIMVAFSVKKQGLHDMIAGTLVIEDKSKP